MEKTTLFIGIVGTNGAGKTELCNYLAQKGFSVFSLSDIVREAARKKDLPLTRDNLVETGTNLKTEFGSNVLATKAYQKVIENNLQHVVFDSIRHISEVRYLKERGCNIIGITASIKTRFDRIKSRQRETDNVDFETFKKQDERENLGKSLGQNINQALEECEVIIENEGGKESLYSQIDKFVSSITEK
jgi:dephospho-CoA kinase